MLGETFADKEVDAERTGTAFTGIFGLNVSLDRINLGARYEHLTRLEMVNHTTKDDVDMFPDGEKVSSDMPSMVAVGASYRVLPALETEASLSYYLNTGVDWEGQEKYLNNGMEVGVGFEYALTDVLSASLGFLQSNSGAEDRYQSDLSYSLNTRTVGLGAKVSLSPSMAVSLGFSNTFYDEGHNDYDLDKFKETYDKTAVVFALGVFYTL